MKHIPVLLDEVLAHIVSDDHCLSEVLDGTFGRGGHSRAILEKYGDCKVTGLDRDEAAILHGQAEFKEELTTGRLELVRGAHTDFTQIFSDKKFSAILLDLGVSSPQLDEGERGFSFYHNGPLDMRMDQRQELTAKTIINEWTEQELSDLFYQLGEVKFPNKVVRKILSARDEAPIESTSQLSELIAGTAGWSKKGQHPATKYFLALRLKVNGELEQLEQVLPDMIRGLEDGGRLLVITFHSLEDRIAKNIFKSAAKSGEGVLVNKKVIQAQWPEKKQNPRARSAKLRVFERRSHQ